MPSSIQSGSSYQSSRSGILSSGSNSLPSEPSRLSLAAVVHQSGSSYSVQLCFSFYAPVHLLVHVVRGLRSASVTVDAASSGQPLSGGLGLRLGLGTQS